MRDRRFSFLFILALALASSPAFGGASSDWPMWRNDAQRSGSTEHALPDKLALTWTRQLPASRPAWPKTQGRLRFDVAPEPIVLGKRIFVPSNANDSLSAYDTETGKALWTFYAQAPVRFAPVAWKENVYVASDDSRLYCLSATDGKVRWSFRGAPAERWVIGNHRLISAWPARGGPVLKDGTIYFAAGIWPFMGIFIHALDAETGAVRWTNSGDGMNYVNQPHGGAVAFATVAPQGHLLISGNTLIVPGGRGAPAGYDLRTGAMAHFKYDKKLGGHRIIASQQAYYLAGSAFRSSDGIRASDVVPQVTGSKMLLCLKGGEIQAYSAESRSSKGGKEPRYRRELLFKAKPAGKPGCIYLKAGPRIYCASGGEMTAFDLPVRNGQAPAWKQRIEGNVRSMLAADGKLLVMSEEARLYCFGTPKGAPADHALQETPLRRVTDAFTRDVDAILQRPGTRRGFGVVLGLGSGRLTEELLQRTELRLVVVDPDAKKVDAFRRKMDAAGLYGYRVAALVGGPATTPLPPYMADLAVSEAPAADAAFVRAAFRVLRPYGGTAAFRLTAGDRAKFQAAVAALKQAQASVQKAGDRTLLIREGPLPGSADWTHHYADAGQTLVSKDELVKAPLGVLWFGGPSHEGILPRHGHGPSPQVAGGRLFIEGPDLLRAVDVYTGRVLWERKMPGFGKYYNNTSHHPGANEIGSNYVSLPDRVYAVYGDAILELEAESGKSVREIRPETPAGSERPNPGYVGVWKDFLVATSLPLEATGGRKAPKTSKAETGKPSAGNVKPVFPRNDTWRYLAGSDAPAGWTETTFDDTRWKSGRAGFGYGDNDDKTELKMRGKFTRVYIRHAFKRGDLPQAFQLALMIRYDDAFIAYLNGKEVVRAGVKGGAGARTKGIRGHEASNDFDYFAIDGWKDLLQENNAIAIEGHNAGAGSSDFTLDPYLVVTAGAPATPRPGAAAKPQPARVRFKDLVRGGRYASGSRMLHVFDRKTGRMLWEREAGLNFRHNAIALGAGKVFCLDRMTDRRFSKIAKGKLQGTPTLYALDLASGKEIWKSTKDVFGTFLNYSAEHDLLLQSGSKNRDRASDEIGQGMAVYQGSDGKELWRNSMEYNGPCLLWKDRVITNGTSGVALELKTGRRIDWSFQRTYGCNTIVGSANLLTFRSGAAGYADLLTDSGTGNLGGFKSGCTSNLIVADGVLNAPDYTRTCTCAYQNQTSLALVHMPENESWTFGAKFREGRIGINFGSPGDRRDANGTLWVDCPDRGGPSPKIDVALEPATPKVFRKHALLVEAGDLRWVASYGLKGLKKAVIGVPDGTYRARLCFMEPDDVKPGQRVFDVLLQGQRAKPGLDVVKEAGGPNRSLLLPFTTVSRGGKIAVEFAPNSDLPPVISGIELVRKK